MKPRNDAIRKCAAKLREFLENNGCFIHQEEEYKAIVFDEYFSTQIETTICETPETDDEDDYEIFFKGIHFKGEIGAFIYFKTSDDKNPIFTLKECNSDTNKMDAYFIGDKKYIINI